MTKKARITFAGNPSERISSQVDAKSAVATTMPSPTVGQTFQLTRDCSCTQQIVCADAPVYALTYVPAISCTNPKQQQQLLLPSGNGTDEQTVKKRNKITEQHWTTTTTHETTASS